MFLCLVGEASGRLDDLFRARRLPCARPGLVALDLRAEVDADRQGRGAAASSGGLGDAEKKARREAFAREGVEASSVGTSGFLARRAWPASGLDPNIAMTESP